MNRFFQRSVFVLSLGLLVALICGELGLHSVRADSKDGAYRQMDVYAKVLQHIQTEYVTEPNLSDVTTGALHGLLETLDADSSYLTPAEYKLYKSRGPDETAQVGMTVSKRFGYAVVVSVVPGSPADKEHFADGDIIQAVGDRSSYELSLAMVRMLLEGKPGTQVVVSVIRPHKSDPEKVTMTRTVSTFPSLSEQQYESSSILYLKPVILTSKRVDEIQSRLKDMAKNNNKKVLLDLRDVTEGDATQALRLANFFLKQGTMATLSGQKYPTQTFTADPAVFLTDAPLAVLVNRGTCGPAELAAAALSESKRADLVGERTFGEGSVQKTIELQDGAALLLTVANYTTPGGKKIADEAVVPGTVVGASPENDNGDEEDNAPNKGDAPLDKALSILKAKAA